MKKEQEKYYEEFCNTDKHYLKCLDGILKDIEDGKTNKVTDITDWGCKDTFSNLGLCAKKYKGNKKYRRDYHMCPFDLRVKLVVSNTYIDGISDMNTGCFYSCETANKYLQGMNLGTVEERIELLKTLMKKDKLAELVEYTKHYHRSTKNKKLSRKLKSIRG